MSEWQKAFDALQVAKMQIELALAAVKAAGLEGDREGAGAGATQGQPLRLSVPWLSQLSATAGFAGGDCSMACAAMVARSYGRDVTVDSLSKASGLPAGFAGASWLDAQRAALTYHVVLEHFQDWTVAALQAELRNGRPVIVIVNYQSIPAGLRYSATYNAGHFVLVVGVDPEHVLVHDPYWPDDQAARGAYVPYPRAEFDRAWGTAAPGNRLVRQGLRIQG